MAAEKFTFWDYTRAVVNRRRLIIINVLAVMVISIIITSSMPRWYRAAALILPPEKGAGAAGILNAAGISGMAMFSGGFSLPVLASESDVMASMLKSRTVIDATIDSLDLLTAYKTKSHASARQRILRNLKVKVAKDGVIKVTYVDLDSIRCAEVANIIIKKMDRFRSELAVQRAKATREFVEQKLIESAVAIEEAEDSLKAFQKKYRIIAPEEQANAAIQAVADIRRKMISKEIELNALRMTHRHDHPDIIFLRNTIAEMNKKIKELESGLAGATDSSSQYLSIPFGDVPDLSLKHAQLTRNLRVQESVYNMLTEQYEQAKIQETKDTPTLSVLDWAIPPTSKFKPKRASIALAVGFLTLIASLVWIFVWEFWQRQKRAGTALYLNASGIIHTLVRDLFGFRGKKV